MTKVTLKPGAELDILTQDELKHTLAEVLSGFARPAQTVWPDDGVRLDANGAGTITFADVCPAGYTFALHRMYLHADGYTAGVPYTSSTGYVQILRAGVAVSSYPLSGGLPAIFTAGSGDAIVYTNGQQLQVQFAGGPASTAVLARVHGTLEPLVLT